MGRSAKCPRSNPEPIPTPVRIIQVNLQSPTRFHLKIAEPVSITIGTVEQIARVAR